MNYLKFSLKYRGAQIWNNLPNTLKISNTYRSFKKSAKVYVQSQTTLLTVVRIASSIITN